MKENFATPVKTPGGALDVLHAQVEAYKTTSKHCVAQLRAIYDDLEYSEDEQLGQLQEISKKACSVWSEAVLAAEEQQDALRHKIEASIKEIRMIRKELSQEAPADSQDRAMQVSCTSQCSFSRLQQVSLVSESDLVFCD